MIDIREETHADHDAVREVNRRAFRQEDEARLADALREARPRQRRGVGSALVRRGIELCRERGYDVVLVVGHREYYPRFGFSTERARSLDSVYSCDAFMALELTPGVLEGRKGTVSYPAPFPA